MKVTQLWLALCDPMDYTVHGILQLRILEWVAIPFSRVSSQPETEPRSPALQVDSLPSEPAGKPNIYSAQCKMMKYWLNIFLGWLIRFNNTFIYCFNKYFLVHCCRVSSVSILETTQILCLQKAWKFERSFSNFINLKNFPI